MRGEGEPLLPGQGTVVRPPPGQRLCRTPGLLSPLSRRGQTLTMRVRSAIDVVICSVSGSLAQLALAPLPMLPPAAWSSWGPALAGPRGFEWGSAGEPLGVCHPAPPWCGGCSYPRERNRSPVCKEIYRVFAGAKCNRFKHLDICRRSGEPPRVLPTSKSV